MNRLLHNLIGAIVLISCLIFSPAFSMEWIPLVTIDFGGNDEVNDNIVSPNPLDPSLGETKLQFRSRFPSSGALYQGCYLLVKYIDDSAILPKGWVENMGDHTHIDNKDKGYFMLFDPREPENYTYRYHIANLACKSNFKFSASVANLNSEYGSDIYLTIRNSGDVNSTILDSKEISLPLADLSKSSYNWVEANLEFSSNGESELFFYIEQNAASNPSDPGNDFALDDISVSVQKPELTISTGDFYYKEPVTFSANLEKSKFFQDDNDIYYRWEYCPQDNAGTWKIVEGTLDNPKKYVSNKNMPYTIPAFDKNEQNGCGNGYYRLVVGTLSQLKGNGNAHESICAVVKTLHVNETKYKANFSKCEGPNEEYLGYTFTDAHDGMTVPVTYQGTDYAVNVTVKKVKEEINYVSTICVGEAYGGKTYNKVEDVEISVDNIPYADGSCDSIVRKNVLKVTTPQVVDDPKKNEMGCVGDVINKRRFDTAGEFNDTIVGSCIRTARVVRIFDVANTPIDTFICQGSMYGGKRYDQVGDFSVSKIKLSNIAGCDSFLVPTLHVVGKIDVDLGEVQICDSEEYVFAGKTYKEPGVYNLKDVGVSSVGCDSITTVKLTINKSYKNVTDTLICRDMILFGEEYTKAGTAVKTFEYKTVNGCDSVEIYNITILDVQLKLRAQFDINSICYGQQTNLIVDLIPSNVPLNWEPELKDNNPLKPTIHPLETTVYVAHARNNVGCHATDSIEITVNDRPTISIEEVLDENRSVKYSVDGGTEPYSILVDERKVGDLASTTLEGMTFGIHELKVVDLNACDDVESFEIKKLEITPDGMFSPNGDGINDKWMIKNIDVYPKSVVSIFDRNGKLLYEKKGYSNEDGWDGTYNGNDLPSTDYWYEIDVEEIDQQYYGHFTLMR